MNLLIIDIGGTHVKVLATGQNNRREFDSGPALTPKQMIVGVRKLVADRKFEAVSIGALEPDDVVLGGGNVNKLKKLPSGSRAGDNNNAFLGGFRLWQESKDRT